MALFKPNLACVIRKPDSRNVYGEEQLGFATPARCSIIKMNIGIVPTTVRADSSASRGAGREFIGDAKLLFPVGTDIAVDYQVEVQGYTLRITNIFPRHDLNGVLDHYEVMCGIWSKT